MYTRQRKHKIFLFTVQYSYGDYITTVQFSVLHIFFRLCHKESKATGENNFKDVKKS